MKRQNPNLNEIENEDMRTQVKALLEPAVRAQFETSPFFKSQVMAKLSRTTSFWENMRSSWLPVTVAAFGLVWVLTNSNLNSHSADGSAGSYVIQINPQQLKAKQIDEAEVFLPEGVKFVSKRHIEITFLRSLSVSLASIENSVNNIPFVVEADKPGRKEIQINFFRSGQIVEKKIVNVEFNEG